MLVDIAFDIAYLHLCNTSCIIFTDNGWCFDSVKATRLLYAVDHSAKPNVFT
jgi:hypothetical protein